MATNPKHRRLVVWVRLQKFYTEPHELWKLKRALKELGVKEELLQDVIPLKYLAAEFPEIRWEYEDVI